MTEEHGYLRTGKKCREKFENLYKYYKKTKEGKAGRQDGKHYRFFRQLEALYGETSNLNSVSETHRVGSSFRFNSGPSNNVATQLNQETSQAPKLSDSLSLSNSSGFNTSSSDDSDVNGIGVTDNDSMEKRKRRGGKRSWKAKIGEFIDLQMRKLMERQEAWLERMMKTIERKEQERMIREDEWRKQEAARIDREHKFWANERAWIEARDSALMEALQKLTRKDLKASSNNPEELMEAELRGLGGDQNDNGSETNGWPECEITRLIQLRTGMEPRFQQSGSSEEILWEEIAAEMGCFGYDKTALMCKNKWDGITSYLMKFKESSKKRKENSRSRCYYQSNESLFSRGGGGATYCENNGQGTEAAGLEPNGRGVSSPSNTANTGNTMNDSCFRFLVGDSGNLWDNYGMKLSKGEND